jgi:hypothetical protein
MWLKNVICRDTDPCRPENLPISAPESLNRQQKYVNMFWNIISVVVVVVVVVAVSAVVVIVTINHFSPTACFKIRQPRGEKTDTRKTKNSGFRVPRHVFVNHSSHVTF